MLKRFLINFIVGLVLLVVGGTLLVFEIGTNTDYVNDYRTFKDVKYIAPSNQVTIYSDYIDDVRIHSDNSLSDNEIRVVVKSYDTSLNVNVTQVNNNINIVTNIDTNNEIKRAMDIFKNNIKDNKLITFFSNDMDIIDIYVKDQYMFEFYIKTNYN